MNKKYLSVVLFGALMLGTAGTFTGCIDNDEPAGIEELRGAKAELLRAKVAVEAAIAARENANATLILAQAETEKAKAAYNEALAEKQRLENELKAAKNEEQKAYYEMLIAQHQQQMEEDVLSHQQQMITLQQNLAEAQRQYELALKQIEIAEALLSDAEKVTVSELKAEVTNAQNKVNTKADAVEVAQQAYYNALLDSSDSTAIKRQELAVERAKSDLAISQETLAKWNSFMESDKETADWRKEITTLEDSIEGINKEIANINIDITRAENSDEYKALVATYNDAVSKYTNYATTAELKYTVGWFYATGDQKEYKVAKNVPYANAVVDLVGTTGEDGIIGELNDILSSYTSQKIALLDEIAANNETVVANAKKASDNAVKAWQDAKAKYDAVEDYDAAKALKTIQAAEKTYNDAIAAAGLISDATKQAEAMAVARINYAKALVSYYTEADKYVGCETNKIKLTVSNPDGTTENVEKTVLAWLSDESYSGYYLSMILGTYSTTAMYTVGGAVKTMGDEISLLNALVSASNTAFGPAANYQSVNPQPDNNYMRVQPTEAEVKAIAHYGFVCGDLGYYYYVSAPEREYEAKNYKTIMADYEKAIEYFTKGLTDLVNGYADAKVARDDAKKAKEAYEEENIEALKEEIAVLNDRIMALEKVKNALISAVDVWFPENGNYTGTESFEDWLAQQITEAEDDVLEKEENLAKAEIALTKLKDGKYDAVSLAKDNLDDAMAELEAAQAELETATANLKTALEIMAKE